METIELGKRSSPAPTYSSTFDSKDKTNMSNNAYILPHQTGATFARGNNAMAETEDNVKPDYQDPSHPHYAGHPVQHADRLPLRPRQPRQWPRKRVLIPCVLGSLLFLIMLWLGSIAFGVKIFSILHPPSFKQEVHEIHIHLTDDSVRIITATPSPITTTIQPTMQFSAPLRPTLDPDGESSNRAPSGTSQSSGIPDRPMTTFITLQRGGVARPSG